jgi:hypothetical protein
MGCRDYHEQLGGLCAWYRTEELLAELRYTGFPDAAFGKEVGWWQVGRGAWRMQHRSPRREAVKRTVHRAGSPSTVLLRYRGEQCVCTWRRRLRQDEEYGRMMDKKAVQSRIRFIVCTDHAHHTRQPRATARKRHDKKRVKTLPAVGFPCRVHMRSTRDIQVPDGRVEDASRTHASVYVAPSANPRRSRRATISDACPCAR